MHQQDTWKSLLHFNGELKITDPEFILSLPDFSLQKELEATIHSFYNPVLGRQNLCRFPARFAWLNRRLTLPNLSLEHCLEFQRFKQKVPVDSISLVYSSENLTQPSSMMGHILLKLSGPNEQGVETSHGISYFTELNSLNVPKILFDSLVTGKKGYFALTPYEDKLKFYLKEEQRNVWEYELAFSTQVRALIQHHIWELKHANLSYFFHDYNCATLTQFIISIGAPALINSKNFWVTPIDVVKSVHQEKVISRTSVLPSSKWTIRMLSQALEEENIANIKQSVELGDFSLFDNNDTPALDYLSFELAGNYLDYLYESKDITIQDWREVSESLERKKKAEFDHINIDVSEFKSPTKTPQDSQFYLGATHLEGEDYIKIGFLPASHYLEDDNRQFFGENELRLSDLAVLYDPKNGRLKLDEFQLYSVSSLVPRNTLTGGISARFKVGVEGHHDKTLKRTSSFNASGGAGFTYTLSTDIMAFLVFNAGYGYGTGKSYFYTDPEVGIVIEEIFDMKSIISLKNVWNQLNSRDDYFDFKLVQSKYLNQNNTIVAKYNIRFNSDENQEQLELIYKYHF